MAQTFRIAAIALAAAATSFGVAAQDFPGSKNITVVVPADPKRTASEFPPSDLPDGAGSAIRLSIGLEDPRDLIADIEQAFAAMKKQ